MLQLIVAQKMEKNTTAIIKWQQGFKAITNQDFREKVTFLHNVNQISRAKSIKHGDVYLQHDCHMTAETRGIEMTVKYILTVIRKFLLWKS